jgi:hypothetical protein
MVRWLFILIPLFLLLQLPLRSIVEPYPAVLLPAGATLMRSGTAVKGSELELLAEDAAGREHPIAIDALLRSVPREYRGLVAGRGFGLVQDRDVRRALGVQLGRPLEPRQRDETRRWLRRRVVEELGIDAVRIKVVTYTVTTFHDAIPVRQERAVHSRATFELEREGR